MIFGFYGIGKPKLALGRMMLCGKRCYLAWFGWEWCLCALDILLYIIWVCGYVEGKDLVEIFRVEKEELWRAVVVGMSGGWWWWQWRDWGGCDSASKAQYTKWIYCYSTLFLVMDIHFIYIERFRLINYIVHLTSSSVL